MIRIVAMFVTADLQAVIHKRNVIFFRIDYPRFKFPFSWFQWYICYRHQTRSQRQHSHEGHLVILLSAQYSHIWCDASFQWLETIVAPTL